MTMLSPIERVRISMSWKCIWVSINARQRCTKASWFRSSGSCWSLTAMLSPSPGSQMINATGRRAVTRCSGGLDGLWSNSKTAKSAPKFLTRSRNERQPGPARVRLRRAGCAAHRYAGQPQGLVPFQVQHPRPHHRRVAVRRVGVHCLGRRGLQGGDRPDHQARAASHVLRRGRNVRRPAHAEAWRQGAGGLSYHPVPVHPGAGPGRRSLRVPARSAPDLRPRGRLEHARRRPWHRRGVCRALRRGEQPAGGDGVVDDRGDDRAHHRRNHRGPGRRAPDHQVQVAWRHRRRCCVRRRGGADSSAHHGRHGGRPCRYLRGGDRRSLAGGKIRRRSDHDPELSLVHDGRRRHPQPRAVRPHPLRRPCLRPDLGRVPVALSRHDDDGARSDRGSAVGRAVPADHRGAGGLHRAVRDARLLPLHGPRLRGGGHLGSLHRLQHGLDRDRDGQHAGAHGEVRSGADKPPDRAARRRLLHRSHERVRAHGASLAALHRRLTMRRLTALLLLALASCGGGPDREALNAGLNERLAEALPAGTLTLASLERRGSQADSKASAGETRRTVYYDAELKIEREFDFGAWDGPGVAGLVSALGAGPKGVTGITSGGNKVGDVLRVHGTALYKRDAGRWVAVASGGYRPAAAPAYATNEPQGAAATLDAMRTVVNSVPKDASPAQREVIDQELTAAYAAIRARLARAAEGYGIAAGPEQGQYMRFARAASDDARAKTVPLITRGGEENLRLLREGKVSLALAQADAALDAYEGKGGFANDGPHVALRAIGSLYPEPVHVLVLADSAFGSVADLKGRRVAIGEPASASRTTALRVIEAHGLAGAFEPRELPLGPALAALGHKEVDAVIQVIGVPADSLRDALAEVPLRLLPLSERAIAALAGAKAGYFAYAIPRGTYPTQKQEVRTVATAALLLVGTDLSETEVDHMTRFVFEKGRDFTARGSAQGAQVSAANARHGLSVPLHIAAARALDDLAAKR